MKGLLVHELTNLSSPRYYYSMRKAEKLTHAKSEVMSHIGAQIVLIHREVKFSVFR